MIFGPGVGFRSLEAQNADDFFAVEHDGRGQSLSTIEVLCDHHVALLHSFSHLREPGSIGNAARFVGVEVPRHRLGALLPRAVDVAPLRHQNISQRLFRAALGGLRFALGALLLAGQQRAENDIAQALRQTSIQLPVLTAPHHNETKLVFLQDERPHDNGSPALLEQDFSRNQQAWGKQRSIEI